MELRDLQLKELDMVKEILPIFERHNLRSFMLGGTLLGAIRHKGFIPWDDDIDIALPRSDYDKFLQIADSELPEHLKLVNFKNDEDYNKYYCKIIDKNITFIREDTLDVKETNLWIDIFPLDGMPNTKVAYKIHKFKVLYRRLMFQYSVFRTGVNIKKKRKPLEAFLIKFGFFYTKLVHLNPKKELAKLDKVITKYPYETSNYVGNHMGMYKFRETFPRKFYDDSQLYDFEDIKLAAPKEYDAVLKQLYGDYMTPPAQDQRFSHSIKTNEE